MALTFLALAPPLLHGQELPTVAGRVADEADAPLPGVLVSVPATYFATTTDEEGRFSLDLPAGSWRLRFRRIGYEPASLSVTVGPETNAVTVRLRAKPVELKGLTVEGRRRQVLEQTVTRETVRQAPPLVEPDVFRALVLLPGVTQPNDIKGRIHLAAGASDETGVRLDGHPLQDPFHLLGVLGAFNVAALDRAEVRMHHLPARLGGYLSGVIDLETRTGAEPQYEGILSGAHVGPGRTMSRSRGPARHGGEKERRTHPQEDRMQDFLLIYQGGDPNWTERSPEEIQAVMDRWGQWFKELEASGNLRDPGAALAPGGATLTKNGDAIVTDTPMAEVKELIGGYSVIQAESLQAAAEIAKGSPFLDNEADGRVLVRPVLSPEG